MWFVVFCIRRSNRSKRSVGEAQRNNLQSQRHSSHTLPSIDMEFHTDCLPVTSPAKPRVRPHRLSAHCKVPRQPLHLTKLPFVEGVLALPTCCANLCSMSDLS